ncbi:MAG: hypothetical protein QXQ75_07665 [Candidatus Nitrosocaldaceae archaeon]
MIVDLLIGSNTMLSTLEIFLQLHGTCFYVLLLMLLIGLEERKERKRIGQG